MTLADPAILALGPLFMWVLGGLLLGIGSLGQLEAEAKEEERGAAG